MMKRINSLILTILFLSMPVYTTSASEDDLYNFTWLDKDKEVYVLQNRVFRKYNTVHFDISGGLSTSGAFVSSNQIQGRLGYFFRESWGFEGIYSRNFGKENNIATDVRNNGAGSGTIPFRRIVDSYAGAMVLWSPFYSKINAFNKIFYMDWVLGVGFASLKETNNKPEVLVGGTSAERLTESHSGLIWELSGKFYLSRNWEIRTDLTAVHYSAEKAKEKTTATYSNWDFGIGIGYLF